VSIKAKQVAGVTTLVVLVVAVLSAYHLATLARLRLEDSEERGQMLAQAILHRAHQVVAATGAEPYRALREDGGVRAMLQSSVGYSPTVLYAAIVDTQGVAVAHAFSELEGQPMKPQEDLEAVVAAGTTDQLRAVFSDRTFEVRRKILAGDQEFGGIRIGVSTILVRDELEIALRRAAGTVVATLIVSSLIAMLLSQWMLRPIHVIQSGLSRLGRGELDVRLDLPEHEFKDLGSSFDAISAQISAMGRAGASETPARQGSGTDLESVMENLEDAVALFSPNGELIFGNTAMNTLFPTAYPQLAGDHPVRQIIERTLAGRKSQGPLSITLPAPGEPGATTERLLMSHAIHDAAGRFLGAMLVARNIAYLSHVHSTLNYSRKLAALGRLMAGVAHEVKNPLNAMTIHLELLKQKMERQAAASREVAAASTGGYRVPASRDAESSEGQRGPAPPDLSKHVKVIADEIRRLDEVVAGFLKFARPDELRLQPVNLGALMSDVATTVTPEAARRGVTLRTECEDQLPDINADPGMLQQALLNLALNACQAMPDGGSLRLACRTASRGRVELRVEDTGVGIPPEDLGRIFDLYFTTKEQGSGIGLSMVYRIVQLHGGGVEVEAAPGAGTRFKLLFPQA
jgi:signal transduction histidine kinase